MHASNPSSSYCITSQASTCLRGGRVIRFRAGRGGDMLWSQFMRKPLASTCWRLLSRLHLQVWVFVSVSAGVELITNATTPRHDKRERAQYWAHQCRPSSQAEAQPCHKVPQAYLARLPKPLRNLSGALPQPLKRSVRGEKEKTSGGHKQAAQGHASVRSLSLCTRFSCMRYEVAGGQEEDAVICARS